MRAAASIALLGLLAVPAVAEQPRDWRTVATLHDRQRLRDWRSAWMTALDEARAGGGAAALSADPALFGADAGLINGALPPAGDYRCRRVALGARAGGPALAIGDWGRCRIDGSSLTGFDGIQRPAGSIYPDGDRRAIFLGTAMFPDEHRSAGYGHAAGRDMAGVIERIGERRWRLALPRPPFGAALDVIDLVPA